METQPAHLQKGSKEKLSTEERDALRAQIIRSKLQDCAPPDVDKAMAKAAASGSVGGGTPSAGNSLLDPLASQDEGTSEA
jgi:hypothetical protein